jgi:hypothetical protein
MTLREKTMSLKKRFLRTASLVVRTSVLLLLLMLSILRVALAHPAAARVLHYAANGNFDSKNNYLPRSAGFDLADVSSVSQLNALPADVKGLVWVGQCTGVDTKFLETVRPYVGNPRVFGFYLMDEPDPTAQGSGRCSAENLKAESDWIHDNVRGALTFIVLLKMSSSQTPSFANTYNPTNSHIDLFGVDPYPCRTELKGCDIDMINRFVTAAESSGIPRSRIVPVFQAFGGGDWVDDAGGRWTLPTVSEEEQILDRWRTLVASPIFDYAYSWGKQNADLPLGDASDLQKVLARHNDDSTTRR